MLPWKLLALLQLHAVLMCSCTLVAYRERTTYTKEETKPLQLTSTISWYSSAKADPTALFVDVVYLSME